MVLFSRIMMQKHLKAQLFFLVGSMEKMKYILIRKKKKKDKNLYSQSDYLAKTIITILHYPH